MWPPNPTGQKSCSLSWKDSRNVYFIACQRQTWKVHVWGVVPSSGKNTNYMRCIWKPSGLYSNTIWAPIYIYIYNSAQMRSLLCSFRCWKNWVSLVCFFSRGLILFKNSEERCFCFSESLYSPTLFFKIYYFHFHLCRRSTLWTSWSIPETQFPCQQHTTCLIR